MAALGVKLMDLLKAGAAGRRHIHLTADDGLDPLRLAGPVEVNGAVHTAVVRDGHSGLAQLLDTLGQALDAAGAVQQAVLCMDMEVYKGCHIPIPFPKNLCLFFVCHCRDSSTNLRSRWFSADLLMGGSNSAASSLRDSSG